MMIRPGIPRRRVRRPKHPAKPQFEATSPRRAPPFPFTSLVALLFVVTMAHAAVASATILEARVSGSSDDAEENARGRINLSSPVLQLVDAGSNQTVGIRWSGLAIPAGATITAAHIQFTSFDTRSGGVSLVIRGQSADNAATFGGNRYNITRRARTSASAGWSPPAWSGGEAGSSESTPDLSAVIQEIVGRAGWARGNALAVIITGSGVRDAWAYDGNGSAAALLHVEFTVAPAPDNPPVARLSVTRSSNVPLAVTADGSGSTDTDSTGIASYRFDFGDGSAAITTTPPTATAQHTYVAAGTYTVTLVVTDTGGQASAPATASVTVGSNTASIAVYAGYYDTHHGTVNPKPNPWQGSPNVVFVGNPDGPSGGWDTSTIRVDNLGSGSASILVTCDIGTHHFALWGTQSVPAGSSLIVAQTALENFDGSDTNPAGCVTCNPNDCTTRISSTIPVVHVTASGTTTNYFDNGQVLNTHGVDAAGCPYTGTRHDESAPWQSLSPSTAWAIGAQAGPDGRSTADAAAPQMWLGPSYPNPNHGEVWARFGIPVHGAVHLAIYDLAGRRVRTLVDGELDAGSYLEHANVGSSPAGMYFCRLTTPGGTLTRSFVVVR